jgi:hypothetical protein
MGLWNGRAWRVWEISEKTSWIEGFTSGYVWATMQVEQLFDTVHQNNAQQVKTAFQALRKTDLAEGLTNLQLAQEVDWVYTDPDNLDLPLDMAIAHALHRLNKQHSEKELREELERFRALVVIGKTKEQQRK